MSFESFQEQFTSACTTSKAFTKQELHLAMAVLKHKPNGCGIQVTSATPKYVIVNYFSRNVGDGTSVMQKNKKSPRSLKSLSKDIICRKLSKQATNIINMFQNEATLFFDDSPFQQEVTVTGHGSYRFFSKPLYVPQTDKHVYPLLDCHHLFVNARSTICSWGIIGLGVKKDAWLDIGKDNAAGLSTAVVVDLIDRQSNAFAQLTFSEDVQDRTRCIDEVICVKQNAHESSGIGITVKTNLEYLPIKDI